MYSLDGNLSVSVPKFWVKTVNDTLKLLNHVERLEGK